ncbi:MAG: response regulator [Proteobacteria bacterium]|nr:response regulator [Pseudomonadota bacterium]
MKKILVIEDNPDNLKLISYALKRCHYDVVSADSGEIGVDLALSDSFSFIIMDIDLPGIDGEEATKRIRADKKGKDVPIIAITSFAMAGDRERILSVGCNGYFEKPIDPLTIMSAIHNLLGIEDEK